MRSLFREDGAFYKANLHAHTTLSDGALSPSEIKALYKENGYSIVAFTDHEVLHDQSHLTDRHFLALNGYEMSFCLAGRSTPTLPTCHLNLLAKSLSVKRQIALDPSFLSETQRKDFPFHLYEGELCRRQYTVQQVSEVLSLCPQAGFLAIVNHPFWSLQTIKELQALDGVWGVEIYNHLCRLNGTADRSAAALDAFLCAGKHPFPIAADDNHNHLPPHDPCFDSFGGFEMICATALTYDAVIEAMEAGQLYASTGPRFEALSSEDGYICFHTSPVREVRLVSDSRANEAVLFAKAGESLTYGRIAIPRECTYVRIEATDSHGHTAWTRTYDQSEI